MPNTERPGDVQAGSANGDSDRVPAPQTISRLGVLRGGYMGIGGEHTGWVLKPSDDGVPATEVDVTKVFKDAAALDGSRVRITGTLITKKYVERGPVEILVASLIERAN